MKIHDEAPRDRDVFSAASNATLFEGYLNEDGGPSRRDTINGKEDQI